jgi:hypothetical protein
VITVNTLEDVVNFDDRLISLREAIYAANTVPGADEIQFDPLLFRTGPRTIAISAGELRITTAVKVTGPGAKLLTIDARESDPTPDVIDGLGSRVFLIRGHGEGGPVGGEVTLSGLRLVGGDSGGDGGAIYSAATLTSIWDCTIENNSAVNGGGVSSFALDLRSSLVTQNYASQDGGAVQASSAQILDCFVSRNSSGRDGGGIAAQFVDVRQSDVVYNSAGGDGGGVRAEELRLKNSEIFKNHAGRDGGGARLSMGANIDSSTIAENQAADAGGGLWIQSLGSTMIASSTISGNGAASMGAGAYFQAASTYSGIGGSIELVHSTIVRNRISYLSEYDDTSAGGGLFVEGGQLTIDHSIIAENGARIGPDLTGMFSASIELRFSLIGRRDASGFSASPDGLPDAQGNRIGQATWEGSALDPLLGPLTNNGGPTRTHALRAGSPAIDSGDASLTSPSPAEVDDQRGAPFVRVFCSRIDVGAYERQNFGQPREFLIDALGDDADGDYSAGRLTLREAVGLANGNLGFLDSIQFNTSLAGKVISLQRGELAIADPLSIYGLGARQITVDAMASDPTPEINVGDGARVFSLSYLDEGDRRISEVLGMRITGGDVTGRGGAIEAYEALRLVDVDLQANFATESGGAISFWPTPLRDTDAGEYSFELLNSTVVANGAENGGGVYAVAPPLGHVRIESTRFTANSALGIGGGACLFAERSARCEIIDSVLELNSATLGGGLRLAAEWTGTAVAQRSQISNNTASHGGGVSARANFTGSFVSFLECEISNNYASVDGGGAHLASFNGGVQIVRSTLNANHAEGVGGGVYDEASAAIRESTVSGNRASDGAALFADGVALFLNFSTVANNHATGVAAGTTGGIAGAHEDMIVKMDSVIVAGNTSPTADAHDVRFVNSRMFIESTLIGFAPADILNNPPVGFIPTGNIIGGPAIGAIDAMLGPLSNNGGPTLTHNLLPGSPAIDAGVSSISIGLLSYYPEFDQRGAPFSRGQGPRLDLGALEFQTAAGALQADFSLDGVADGSDFLVWQRNVGRRAYATFEQGDATGDLDVDGYDLSVWRARAAEAASPQASGLGLQGGGEGAAGFQRSAVSQEDEGQSGTLSREGAVALAGVREIGFVPGRHAEFDRSVARERDAAFELVGGVVGIAAKNIVGALAALRDEATRVDAAAGAADDDDWLVAVLDSALGAINE